jgi:acetoin utilization deacetylase AcuC-like enzyme
MTLNLPLPHGTDWAAYRPAAERALNTISGWKTDLLIVSFGADTYEADPISKFALRTEDYGRLGKAIRDAGLPTAIIMEGGYAVDALGTNVAAFLAAFATDDDNPPGSIA